jgi:hypothetical protein
MKTGDYVKLEAPVTGDQLAKFLNAHGSTREAYVRVEGTSAVLYLVTRETDKPQNGRIFASFPLPLLPEEA